MLPLRQLDGGKRQVLPVFGALIGLVCLARSWSPLAHLGGGVLVGGLRWSHPSVMCPERPVPLGGRVRGFLCVLVFPLTFVPVPFGS
jgi:hypothetical protein